MLKSSISTMDGTSDSSISSTQTNPEAPQNATFANLPEICLDKILASFHIKELIEVSKTNLALRHSATRVFRMKYGKKKFEIKSGNAKYMAQMIIHFGRQISNISLRFCAHCPASSYRPNANLERNLLKVIFDECSTTLKELTICNTYGVTLSTSFPNLQTINYHIVGCSIHPTWFQINQWFPTVRKISISDHYGKSEIDEILIHRIPNLKELLLLSNTSNIISIPMAQLINTNHHIESLRIRLNSPHIVLSLDYDGIEKFQSAINWDNLMVSNLDIRQEPLIPMIHLDNIAKLKNLKSLAFSADVYPNVDRFSFALNKLLIETDGQNATTINFIVNQRSLEWLSIKCDGGLGSNYLKRIAEHLKNLTEISFDILDFVHPNGPEFCNGLIEFVRHCKALKMICVTYVPSEEIPKDNAKIKHIREMYADLEEKIGKISKPDKWKLYYECKVLDIEFDHLGPARFLMALQASKHSYNFRFSNEF